MMKRKTIFLILTLVGFLLPMSEFFQFLYKHGIDFNLFFEQLLINHISAFFAWDLAISSIVFLVWASNEAKERNISHFWLYIVLNFMLGLSVAFPYFLYIREGYIKNDVN